MARTASAIRRQPQDHVAIALAGALNSEAKTFELRFAPIMDADRARLFAIGERHEQIGQLGVGTMHGAELLDASACPHAGVPSVSDLRQPITPVPAAQPADDGECRLADVGQGKRAVAGHGFEAFKARVCTNRRITSL